MILPEPSGITVPMVPQAAAAVRRSTRAAPGVATLQRTITRSLVASAATSATATGVETAPIAAMELSGRRPTQGNGPPPPTPDGATERPESRPDATRAHAGRPPPPITSAPRL